MENFFMFLFLSFSLISTVYANYTEEEKNLTAVIKDLEELHDYSQVHLYVDRARLYFIQDRFQEALLDVNKAIESQNLQGQDVERAVVTRMLIFAKLGRDKKALADLELYKKVNPNFPKMEFFEDKIVIRNMPEGECERNAMKTFLLLFCDKEEDITTYSSNVCIVKRKKL